MTQFKTTKGWKHQVALHEDGFTYDSATYKFSDVDYLISESTATYLNGVVHVKQLNDFKFLICLKDGTDLHQGIKLTGKQILMAFGWWAFLSDEEIQARTSKYLNIFKDTPYIFNLGHGLLPETDPDKVGRLIKFYREYKQ